MKGFKMKKIIKVFLKDKLINAKLVGDVETTSVKKQEVLEKNRGLSMMSELRRKSVVYVEVDFSIFSDDFIDGFKLTNNGILDYGNLYLTYKQTNGVIDEKVIEFEEKKTIISFSETTFFKDGKMKNRVFSEVSIEDTTENRKMRKDLIDEIQLDKLLSSYTTECVVELDYETKSELEEYEGKNIKDIKPVVFLACDGIKTRIIDYKYED
jgi:hypothetical protein